MEPGSAPSGTLRQATPPDPAAAWRAHLESFREWRGSQDGAADVRLFFAPGRVNLMGAHLDYNGGPVMPLAIDRGTFLAVAPRRDGQVRLGSTREPGEVRFDPLNPPARRQGQWHDYPIGVLRLLAADALRGGTPQGLDILFGGNLPVGAGLSSSASICVGTAFALDRVWGLGVGAQTHVRVALEAERNFVGVRCGVMDPYAVGLARAGQILWLDCKDLSTQHIPLDGATVSVAVADSGVRRALSASSFNQRVSEAKTAFELLRATNPRATCLRDVEVSEFERVASRLDALHRRRARHVVREVERTFQARTALLAGDLAGFGRRMTEAHASLRDDYEVSVAELDTLVESAIEQPGVYGARLTGAGFGGCVAILLAQGAAESALPAIAAAFRGAHGSTPVIEVFRGDPGPREIECAP